MQSRASASPPSHPATAALHDDADADEYTDLDLLDEQDPATLKSISSRYTRDTTSIDRALTVASSHSSRRQDLLDSLRLPIPNSHLSRFSSRPATNARRPSPKPLSIPPRASDGVALDGHVGNRAGSPDDKDARGLDWYVEGPGRRVGYADRSAIDWIYEYGKERQRLRVLRSSTSGFSGYLRQLADASHIWIVLVLTGIATGVLAAIIDVASDWLADLKSGVCTEGPGGGKFYLNKAFCCWGLEGVHCDCVIPPRD